MCDCCKSALRHDHAMKNERIPDCGFFPILSAAHNVNFALHYRSPGLNLCYTKSYVHECGCIRSHFLTTGLIVCLNSTPAAMAVLHIIRAHSMVLAACVFADTGARKVNAGIQYCMSYPKHVLQSVEIPAVTQFRAGDDYGPGQSTNCHFPYCVYYIGTTSIVAWALDLAPAKDNFWSTTGNETDSPYSPSTHEPYSEMECAISAFSTGPVQPSDKIGFSNSSLILQACTTNGTLLQPSKPATTIDECFAQAAGFGTGPVATKEYNEPVMSTHSQVSGHKWVHVLSIGLNSSFDLYPRHVPLEMDSTATYIQYTRDDVPAYGGKVSLKEFSATSPMRLAPCLYTDFGVTYAAPVLGNGMAILGEMAKWVPLSPIRFRAIDEGAGGAVTITLAGAPNEVVHVATYHSGAITDTVCTLNADGMGTLNL
eukprot:m.526845 g.526845  ORF g.526845 m.526845 type:complete len:426 (-) comp22006_c0_seq4:232-1509(-)